jgi:hypothetical protein
VALRSPAPGRPDLEGCRTFVLSLGDTQVSDAGQDHLKRLTNLKVVSVHTSKITDAGEQESRREMPKVVFRQQCGLGCNR